MPKYNKMLEGFDKIVFDGVIETHKRKQTDSRESSSSGSSEASGDTDNRYSDTPQNSISDIKNGEYVTDYTYNQTSSNTSTSTEVSDSGELNEDITIVRGDPIEEYSKYLEVMNSIYEMIFKECDSLFYGII